MLYFITAVSLLLYSQGFASETKSTNFKEMRDWCLSLNDDTTEGPNPQGCPHEGKLWKELNFCLFDSQIPKAYGDMLDCVKNVSFESDICTWSKATKVVGKYMRHSPEFYTKKFQDDFQISIAFAALTSKSLEEKYQGVLKNISKQDSDLLSRSKQALQVELCAKRIRIDKERYADYDNILERFKKSQQPSTYIIMP